jgi:hypothetical protein
MSADLKVRLESLNFHQALLWLLIHERRRHLSDIVKIDGDIAKLEAMGVRLQGFTDDEFDMWVEA